MAKYTPESTTVGELLDDPQAHALFEKYIPAVLEHPLLEVGRTFVLNDALPYVSDMVSEEDMNKFIAALSELN